MGIRNPFRRRQPGHAAQASPPVQQPANQQQQQQQQGPTTGPPGNGHSPLQEGGQLNLVNYKPEELVKQVDDTISRVQFGMSRSRRYMHLLGDIWANIGPWVLLAGTVGEVFAFIWITTTNNDPKNNPAWWVALSILATVISLEFTFMVVSFKSAAIRNDAEHRPTGATSRDKHILGQYRLFWVVLAVFVGVGQVAFLLDAMTQHFSRYSGVFILLVVFAILRTIGTLVSDFYTAFAHQETPTTAQQAQQEQEERAAMSAQLLQQKSQEVSIMNDGIQAVMRAQSKGQIEQDDLRTELRLKHMENQNRIDTMQAQSENAQLMSRMGNNLLRAIFDDQLPEEDRQRILQGIQGLLHMNQQLPPGYRTIREEKEDDD